MTLRPTIISASSDSGAVGSAVPTILPRRITVIRSATALTSRSLWVMKTIDLPAALSPRITLEQLVGLLRGEHGGRLVEDQQVDVAGQRLDDLHPLLDADRQVLDDRLGFERQAVLARHLAHELVGRRVIEEAGPCSARRRA